MTTTLVVVAVAQERDAVVRDLGPVSALDLPPYGEGFCGHSPCCVSVSTPAGELHVVPGGVGPASAGAATATALAAHDYDRVISAGIAGGFAGRAAVGDVVVADVSTAADLGCRTDDGFRTLRDLGLGVDTDIAVGAAPRWAERLEAADLAVVLGQVLTLSCMTGTDAGAEELARRYPRAVAEAMEGWGVTWPVHIRGGIALGEVRTISNLVGRRDPTAWDLAAAFDALARAFAVLLAEPLP